MLEENVNDLRENSSLVIDGEELKLAVTDRYGYTFRCQQRINVCEKMNPVEKAVIDMTDQLGKYIAYWPNSEEDKTVVRNILLDKAELIKDQIDPRPFTRR